MVTVTETTSDPFATVTVGNTCIKQREKKKQKAARIMIGNPDSAQILDHFANMSIYNDHFDIISDCLLFRATSVVFRLKNNNSSA